MTLLTPKSAASRPVASPLPPLAQGDHLTRAEFERRYEAMPDGVKAELIEGIVYMSPPVSLNEHAEPHMDLMTLLGHYKAYTPGIRGGDNGTLRLDLDNMPQPDGFLMINPDRGGQAKIEGNYVTGAPELIVEIAASSASYDLHEKLRVYRRNGVKEYIVWRTYDRQIDYFMLHEGEYKPAAPDATGTIRSLVMPGLWLIPAAILSGEMPAALKTLQAGIASSEHTEFVANLKARVAGG
jgi:Uma2 family endonuclease